ncbi:MAG: DMT family transporter [Candidatus Latescibacteria bacterium]|nr:DMT family transporter [Candidatus Latescibacterota bacterium]
MSYPRALLLTAITMVAFASNSLLCRAALRGASIDAAAFTALRLASGAVMLALLSRLRRGRDRAPGSWRSALALFAYAACFSFTYLSLPAATGALLLFGAVQATMIGHGISAGERMGRWQWFGVLLALGGLIGLLLPGLSAPPLVGAVLMLGAGVAWGVYSLRGRRATNPVGTTAGNFLRATPFALALVLPFWRQLAVTPRGALLAVASGALASGLGYTIWYLALPALKATQAATVQLSVPVIAGLGGVLLLGEPLGLRLALASLAILGGIALVILERRAAPGAVAVAPEPATLTANDGG